ncbi:MAG: serine/threonine-protein phosphatase [bacterium]|nr:serine/threonine-protein phosphatase [bacterium]
MYKQQDEIRTVQIYQEDVSNSCNYPLYIASHCTQGQRKSQQDNSRYSIEYDHAFAIVCDGMGGMQGGEKASEIAVSKFEDFYHDETPIADKAAFFRHAIKIMDRAICGLRNEAGKPLGAGSTMVAVIIEKDKLYWTGVGDSKIYILRGEDMICVTREHNYRLMISQYYEEGSMTAEEYVEEDKRGDALISYLGMGQIKMMDVTEKPFQLEAGDIIMLCSDGIYKTLSEETLKTLIRDAGSNMEAVACNIIDCINQADNPTQDNATLIAIIYQPDGDRVNPEGEQNYESTEMQ